jgi:hypothetical protein
MADDDHQEPPSPPPAAFLSQSWDVPQRRPIRAELYETGSSSVPLPLAAMLQAKAAVTLETEVIRAPFSELGIAERLAQNPDFYRQLLHLVAGALRKEAESYHVQTGQENSAGVIKAELNAIAERFDRAAVELEGESSARFATAAKTIAEIRDQIARFAEDHPDFTKTFFELTAVILGCYALHQIGGASADLSALVTYAVVRKEKLSDIFKNWSKKKDDSTS